jgi:hypothetical protein
VKFLTSRAAAAVLADPGLGKTTITLAAFTQLLKAQTAYGLLIIAGIKKGLILEMPFSLIFMNCSSMMGRPPIPTPMMTPVFDFWRSDIVKRPA